jgi:hypothetical protein
MGKAGPNRAPPSSELPVPKGLKPPQRPSSSSSPSKLATSSRSSSRSFCSCEFRLSPKYSLTHEPRPRLYRLLHLPHHPLSRPLSSVSFRVSLTVCIRAHLRLQSDSVLYLSNNSANMAAPRTSSFKILRNLQKASSSVPAKRSLHITGVNSSPRPVDFSQKHSYAPLSIQTLRSECSKRSLTPSGTKHELVERLAVHDELQARAFSIAMKRIAGDQARKPSR